MKIKIAVYSGAIPSTTFIERLIVGLSQKGCVLYLFGNQTKKVTYPTKSINIKSYSDNRLQKMFFLLKYSFLLAVFKNSEKKKLDTYINKTAKNKLLSKIKYYPVLWYHPDIFHLQWAKSIEDWMWVQNFGIKLVLSLRGTHTTISPVADLNLKKVYEEYYTKVNGFHAVSQAIAHEAQKYGASPNTIKVVYSGLQEREVKINSQQYNNTFQILSVGRNHWVKGYHYALDAMNLLHEKGFNFRYTIIGAKGVEELEFQKSDLGLKDLVSFKSNVPFAEVQQLMQQADLVLLPSVEEGIANVVLEAMQLGTLVLTTDCGGMNEVIEDEKNGFIIPTRNPQKMAEAIQQIIALSETQKQQITEAAIKTIQQQHTEEKMVADMLTLYQNVLAS